MTAQAVKHVKSAKQLGGLLKQDLREIVKSPDIQPARCQRYKYWQVFQLSSHHPTLKQLIKNSSTRSKDKISASCYFTLQSCI
jgi:hypothetical protein